MSALDSHFNEVYGITCAYGTVRPRSLSHLSGVSTVQGLRACMLSCVVCSNCDDVANSAKMLCPSEWW